MTGVWHNGVMAEFEVLKTSQKDSPLVSVGDPKVAEDWRIQIPKKFQRLVVYPLLKLNVELTCVFNGDKIEVTQMRIISDAGHFVTSRDLTQLSLPAAIRSIGFSVIPNADIWSWDYRESHSTMKQIAESTGAGYLSQLYWFEHITWGTPRVAIQQHFGCTRSVANAKIREIAKQYRLPGVHATASKIATAKK